MDKFPVISNDINAKNKNLILITGANQGGKTTALRSIGISQILMQIGAFVPAKYFKANICNNIFTHFLRPEDKQMNSGKLDEELKRMNNIINFIKPGSLILFNESFSSTNEREGSIIAYEIVKALLENNIKIVFVTHLYEFTTYFLDKSNKNILKPNPIKINTLFLTAERKPDGKRTFKLIETMPQQTGFGNDILNEVFNSQNCFTSIVK